MVIVKEYRLFVAELQFFISIKRFTKGTCILNGGLATSNLVVRM